MTETIEGLHQRDYMIEEFDEAIGKIDAYLAAKNAKPDSPETIALTDIAEEYILEGSIPGIDYKGISEEKALTDLENRKQKLGTTIQDRKLQITGYQQARAELTERIVPLRKMMGLGTFGKETIGYLRHKQLGLRLQDSAGMITQKHAGHSQ